LDQMLFIKEEINLIVIGQIYGPTREYFNYTLAFNLLNQRTSVDGGT